MGIDCRLIIGFLRGRNARYGGVATRNAPTSPTGLNPQSFLRQLEAMGEAARHVNRERYSKQNH